ncbi:MAG: hypothetical protein SNJ82_06615 [Gemmataceae bacterium]
MNEEDWLLCREPTPMIRHLLVVMRHEERKLRLLACAACRQVWNLLSDSRSRRAVEVAELFADGLTTLKELARARGDALLAAGCGERSAAWSAYWAANTKASGPLWNAFAAAAGASARHAVDAVHSDQAQVWDDSQAQGNRQQADLIREVIGNPFRPAVPLAPWLRWNHGLIPAMARSIYREHAWDQMPILGDALEEAGCTDSLWLDHCRSPINHVRGCWLLDALGAAPTAAAMVAATGETS